MCITYIIQLKYIGLCIHEIDPCPKYGIDIAKYGIDIAKDAQSRYFEL